MEAYKKLETRFRRLFHLQHAQAILSWDEATLMPADSGDARAEAKASIAVLSHEILVKEDMLDLIEKAKTQNLDPWQKRNLNLMERQWKNSACIPDDLVERMSRVSSRCEQAWRIQRKNEDWAAHLPLLEEVLSTQKEIAQIKADVFKLSAYDALLDQYEPGLRQSRIDTLFAELRNHLPDMLKECLELQSKQKILMPKDRVPIERQEKLGRKLMELLQFNFNKGRLDVSHHPFCGGVPQDVRLTTRYMEDDFVSSIMGILHETGHAKYQQNLPVQWQDQPVGDALGMSVHESQSLFIEMQISRSPEFLSFIQPIMMENFKLDSNQPEWSLDNIIRIYTRVRPGYIRVDADELTYPLHILLRYEIERDLIEGKLNLRELPEVWDQKMKSYLGLSTKGKFADGCMQDIHWPFGLFGYFPCYTLGAMMAAQWNLAIRKAIPDLSDQIRRGELAPLMDWLKTNIHEKASLYTADELVKNLCGEELNAKAFIDHLKLRYLNRS